MININIRNVIVTFASIFLMLSISLPHAEASAVAAKNRQYTSTKATNSPTQKTRKASAKSSKASSQTTKKSIHKQKSNKSALTVKSAGSKKQNASGKKNYKQKKSIK